MLADRRRCRLRVDAAELGERTECVLRNLTECDVWLGVPLAAVRVENLTRCRVLCGAVQGSLFVRACNRTLLVGAAGQARIHDSRACTFQLLLRSSAVIEHCTTLQFGPRAAFDGDAALLAAWAGVGRLAWRAVLDFDHIHQSTPSPNFALVDPAEVDSTHSVGSDDEADEDQAPAPVKTFEMRGDLPCEQVDIVNNECTFNAAAVESKSNDEKDRAPDRTDELCDVPSKQVDTGDEKTE